MTIRYCGIRAQAWNSPALTAASIVATACVETPGLFQVFPMFFLSPACLGKPIIFTYGWEKERPFSYLRCGVVVDELLAWVLGLRKRLSHFEFYLRNVPSLSW
jgi:hypothetical protein